MASTREITPASAGSASPTQLTPRSKVQAMLAAMGDDSDEDNATALPKSRSTSLFANLPRPTRQSPAGDVHQEGDNGEDTEEEEDVEISRPRGRMAARMHAAEESDQESPANDARERVRKMLAAESKKTKAPSPDVELQNDSSEDEDLHLLSRRRRAQKLRTPTPQPKSITRNSESPGGLFVSPASGKRSRPASVASESDEDLPANLGSNARFQALVQKKREERKAREAELAKEKAEKAAKRKNFSKMVDEDEELDVSDSETEQRLTQPVRVSRKASKRALEEMKRETQRMSRNMQLAHEARTKKKITKDSLFAKFNYRQSGAGDIELANQTKPASSSSALQSESETRETTPLTSPSLEANMAPKAIETPVRRSTTVPPAQDLEDDVVLESLEDLLAQIPKKIDKGKAPQDMPSSPPNLEQLHKNQSVQKHDRKDPVQLPAAQGDSDSDLEITYAGPRTKNRKKKIDAIFDRVPARQAQESHSLQALRLLAHLSSPGKTNKGKSAKPSMTNAELQMSLQQQIRQQAARERAEREQSLRDRGIHVLTAEEREKEMGDVEDLIAKARREADEITKKEKDEAKRERKENGEVDPLGDSSDDEDWQEEKEHVDEALSGSGSENELYDGPDDDGGDASGEDEDDEDAEDAMSEDGQGNERTSNEAAAFFDHEASETESEQETRMDVSGENEDAQAFDLEEEEEDILPATTRRRRGKNANILSDDEEEPVDRPIDRTPAAKHVASPMPPRTMSPVAPTSVLRSATKTFIPGLTVAGPAGLGLTQIFQGTMDDSQTQLYSDTTVVPETSSGGNGQDSMAFLRQMAPPTLPAFESTVDEESQDIIMDSQPGVSQVPASQPPDEVSQPLQLQFSQSQIHGFDSLVQEPFATQYSEFPEQTQDAGFQIQSPLLNRFVSQSQAPQSTVPQSTVETVLIEPAPTILGGADSPTVKKLGRLRRRNQIQRQSDDEAEASNDNPEDGEGFDISANAFDVMRRAAKKKRVVEDFDKNKSKAKEMVHEQAEESEDEYAGLGGASDDESGGEQDALVQAMIDDEAGKDGDERQLAAFYADKERAKDSKEVEKLFKDITNGTLRRKRGGDYSLSDSEDDGEARRNKKRKEFARMRKALLEDERIGKIALNPKQSAFLAAIEDREKDDEIDFLDTFEDSQEAFESQSQGDSQGKDTEMTDGVQVPGSQPDTSMGPPKRKRGDDDMSDIENRPPPNLRRTKGTKRPSNLSEVRQSLSSLIEERNTDLDVDDSDSDLEIVDQEDEDGNSTDREFRRRDAVERDPFAARRNANIAVVDRISLKRSSSSNISSTTKLAFSAPTTSSRYNVKVPPLLRKATSNLSTTSTSSGISGMGKGALEAAGLSSTGGIKRGGGRTSGIAYQARETERRKAVEEGEKRREKRKFKGAEKRREAVGGLFGKGSFE